MFDLNDGLNLEHIVVFTRDKGIFIRARDRASGRIRLFLLLETQRKAYVLHSRQNSWEQLEKVLSASLLSTVRQEIDHGHWVIHIAGDVSQLTQERH